MYPKLFTMFGERLFVTDQLKFFFNLLENMLQERSASKQVNINFFILPSFLFSPKYYGIFPILTEIS